LGLVSIRLNEFQEGEQFAQESLVIMKKIDMEWAETVAFTALAASARTMKRFGEARRYLNEGLKIAREVQFTDFTLLALSEMALLQADQGQKEQAVELLALCAYHPANPEGEKINATRQLAKLEAELAPEIYAAAAARGRALELDQVLGEFLDIPELSPYQP